MSKKNNNNIQNAEVAMRDIKKFENRIKIKLPEDYAECLLANKQTLLNGKAVLYYRHHENRIIADIIDRLFLLNRSEQQEPYSVPLKTVWNQFNCKEKQAIDYMSMLCFEATGFCLSDLMEEHIGLYLPIGISKGGNSLICLGLYGEEYGKVYIYTKASYERYDFLLLANSFADLVENLVESESAVGASRIFERFSKEDIKALDVTARLQRLKEIANTITAIN